MRGLGNKGGMKKVKDKSFEGNLTHGKLDL